MDAENGIDEDRGQLNNPETSREKEEIGATFREALGKLLELEEGINKSRNEIINKILSGIRNLESTYEERLTELEEDVKKLKEEGGEGKPAFDFIPPKGVPLFSIDIDTLLENDLNNKIISEKLRDEFETKNVTLSESATISKEKEDLWLLTSEDEIYSVKKEEGKLKVYDKLKGIITALNYLKGSGVDKRVEKIKQLYELGSIPNLEDEKFNKELLRVRLIMGLVRLLPEKDKKIPRLDGVNTQLVSALAQSEKDFTDLYVQVMYTVGVTLLKTGDFRNGYEYFKRVTDLNPTIRGAWLNRGVAAGGLGDIDDEIESYKKANYDNNYDKASKNLKKAKRKKELVMKMLCIIRLFRKERSKEPTEVKVK